MSRVVIDARESGTSTGRYVDKLIENLHQLKPSFEIVVLAKARRLDFVKSIAPSFEVIESNFQEFTLGEQLGLKFQIAKLKPDLVHFGMTHQPVLYCGKTVTTIHDLTTARFVNPAKNRLIYGVKQGVYRWLIKKVAKKSQILLTPSQFVKDDVAQYANVNENKIIVTHEAADRIADAPKPIHELQTTDYLLYVGRATPHKNLQRAVDAFAIVQKTHKDLKFVLAGENDANYQLLKNYADSKNIKGLVFPGRVSESQLRWLYENAKVYVFPSLSEGFGLPGLEAMTHGLPVAASNASCLPEVYRDGALYFDPLSPADISKKINQILDDPKSAKELKAKGRKVATSYSWQRMAKQTLDVYTKVLGTK